MTNSAIITIQNEVWCSVARLNQYHMDMLWEMYAPYVDGYRHMPAYKLGRWDGKIRFFEKTGKTYVKLLGRIIPQIEKWGYHIELIDKRYFYKVPNLVTDDIFIGLSEKEIYLRPYQVEAVNLCIENGEGFILAGTGAGKSLMTAALSHAYSLIGHKAITIVPSSDLVEQTAEWYSLLGMDTGIYSGDTKDSDHINVVATWQSLQNVPRLMKEFQVVIWDESHGAKAHVAQQLLNENGSHIPFRFGVTGTFPKPEADKLSLHASIGDILKEIPSRWLIDNGYLADVDIEQICLRQPDKQEFPDYAAEKAYLSKNEDRMEVIAGLVIQYAELYGNTLVLINSIPFGEKLTICIGGNAVFLYGGSKKAERKEQYDLFETQDDMIVVASSGIASTGISIDRVKCLVFVDAGKSFIKTIQSVGRGTRLASDKKEVKVIDIYADLKWSKAHARERKKWYKETEYQISKSHTIKI